MSPQLISYSSSSWKGALIFAVGALDAGTVFLVAEDVAAAAVGFAELSSGCFVAADAAVLPGPTAVFLCTVEVAAPPLIPFFAGAAVDFLASSTGAALSASFGLL